MTKYKVTLTKEEYEELMSIVNKGSHASQQYRTAYILLNSDQGEYGCLFQPKSIPVIQSKSIPF